jgi:hypothetical protein
VRSSGSFVVIAGLDPAIQDNRAGPAAVRLRRRDSGAASMDRRVEPGDDTEVDFFTRIAKRWMSPVRPIR